MCRSIFIQSSASLLLVLLLLLMLLLEVNRESLILHSAKNSVCLEPSITSMSRSRSKKNTLDTCQRLSSAESLLLLHARVVEWQTRTFEGRMPKGLRVQVPPRAEFLISLNTFVAPLS